MERREIVDLEDGAMLRHSFLVEGLTAEQVKTWAESPITRALMFKLPKDGVMLAMQYEQDCAMVHFAFPLDIMKAIEETGEPLEIKDGPGVIIRENPLLK
ncbi:MAG: hypothetical protein IKX56_02595 [Muribaculaceae bacterium]|nr:hypothetical protein [Muribaculaceae bacterium]